MGGAFGGMMMRVANGLGMGCYSDSRSVPSTLVKARRSRSPEETWCWETERETRNTLDEIKMRREIARGDAICDFERALLDNQQALKDAGLLKEGDTLYRILCRASGVPYRKRKRKC